MCKILQDDIDLTYEQSCAKAGIENITYRQASKLCDNIIRRIAWKHISYKYDFTNKINNQRVKFTDELKENLIIRYMNGESYESIYNSLYPLNKQTIDTKAKFLVKFRKWLKEYNLKHNIDEFVPRLGKEKILFTSELNQKIIEKYKNGYSDKDLYSWIYNENFNDNKNKFYNFKKKLNDILESYYYIILPDGYKIPIVERINNDLFI